MTRTTVSLLFLLLAVVSSTVVVVANPHASSRKLTQYYDSTATSFLVGSNLGVVDFQQLGFVAIHNNNKNFNNPSAVKQAAAAAALGILTEHKDFTGNEVMRASDQKIGVDNQGNVHVRLQQYVEGLPIDGASIMIHINGENGSVFALNGEPHSAKSIIDTNFFKEGELDCETAVEIALEGRPDASNGKWESPCEAAAVQGRDGKPYLAYKRLRGYNLSGGAGPYQRDLLFASRYTGALLAVHPKIYGALSVGTFNCLNGDGSDDCPNPISTSNRKIYSSDVVANDAHNYAIDTYYFYFNYFGRDSLDDNGIQIRSYVHLGVNYDNAYYAGDGQIAYGDGDGFFYTYFCKGFDVVVHELSHGVTDYTSALIYQDESGALNEAFSDIMAAAGDRLVKRKTVSDVWLIAEDVDIFPGNGRAIRNMANPSEPPYNDPDHYADRYRDPDGDNGGVHVNSNIINYAFVLLVQGGAHRKSGIVVPPLDPDFDTSMLAAAKIFYDANSKCFTESTNFVAARQCTLMYASAAQQTSVATAWDAVGVRDVLSLSNGVQMTGLSLAFSGDVQYFALDETVPAATTVTCTVEASSGNPYLKVQFGSMPDVDPVYFTESDCESSSPENTGQCTTGPSTAATKVYVSVEVNSASSDLSVGCRINAPTCKGPGTKCTSRNQCCGILACGGSSPSNRICKACKKARKRCTSASECCTGLKCTKTSRWGVRKECRT